MSTNLPPAPAVAPPQGSAAPTAAVPPPPPAAAMAPVTSAPAPATTEPQNPPAPAGGTELAAVPGSGALVDPRNAVPAYLREIEETGLETAAAYIIPPRLKIVQALSQPPISDLFNPGDVIAQPQNILVAGMPYANNRATGTGTPFTFVPLFFYVEWCTWNPRGEKQVIRDRTLDDKHPIACKARDPRGRKETLPDGKEVRHCEHFCFVVMLDVGPFAGMPMMMTFVKGEHRTGSNFLSLARMRKAPLFAQRFVASVGERRNDEGEWYGFNIANPSDNAWVAEDQIADNKRRYQELREAHEKHLLRADYEDDNEEIDATSRSSSEF